MTAAPMRAVADRSLVAHLLVVLVGSWLLAAISQIEIPMEPVPLTMQTFGVLMIGALCGFRLSFQILAAYLIQGAVGLPFFAGGAGGYVHLIGKTGGYLFGFLVAASAIGWLRDKGLASSWYALIGALTLGHVIVFAIGVPWLAMYIGMENAWVYGFVPFILGTVLKTALAAAVTLGLPKALPSLWNGPAA